jgi:hypothetical protein
MKKQLLKKFYAFIVTAILCNASANAQIVYTDVNPDTSMICSSYPCSKTYGLDLNNDGTVDFTLSASHNHVTCSFQNYSDTKSVSIFSQGGNLAAASPITTNYSIGNNLSFSTNGVTLRSIVTGSPAPQCPVVPGSFGSWTNPTDYYIGLRLSVGADTYFGWARLNVDVASTSTTVSCTVKDYAYNTIPNQSILAGQTVATGINENSFASLINLFPNPATNYFTIALPNANEKVEITITDITGKIIYSTTVSETQKIEVNTNDFAEGVYLVQVQSADFIATKKLVVEK